MLKRIGAWILLVGFAFLIVNILVLGFYRVQSMIIYAFVAVAFLFASKKK